MPDRRPGRGAVTGMLAATVVLIAAVLSGCGSAADGEVALDRHGYHGSYVDPPYTVPAVALTDQSGRRFTLARDRRDLDVVFFGYTNCPDICRLVMSQLTSAYLHLPETARSRVRVVFVTTDPARDDARALTSYLARYDRRFTGLTGPLAAIERLARPLGIYIKAGERLPSGGYAVDHTTSVIAVGHGRAPLVWSGDTAATDIAADIVRLLDATPRDRAQEGQGSR